MSPQPKHSTLATETPDGVRPKRRRRPLVIALVIALVVALLAVAAVVVWHSRLERVVISGGALTASSTHAGSTVRNLADSGSASAPGADWESDGPAVGTWFEMAWNAPKTVGSVELVRNPLDQPGVTDGFLTFGDGSHLQVTLSRTSRDTVIPMTPRSVDRFRFTASAVSAGAADVTISEVIVRSGGGDGVDDVVTDDAKDGNAATAATATASPGASDPRALRDGAGGPGAGGAGDDWSVPDPAGAWVQFDWDRPRELTSIELMGSSKSGSALSHATLTFGDGASIPVGAVLPTPDRPTVVGFMPRVTRSIRLTVDGVSGSGPLVLAELRAYERGATPVRSSGATAAETSTAQTSTAQTSTAPAAGAAACAPPPALTPAAGVVVDCPVSGSSVDGVVNFRVSAPAGSTSVTAVAWPADRDAPDGTPVAATPDGTGAATFALDLSAIPAGPLTVKIEATGGGTEVSPTYFQLYKAGAADADPPASDLASGRTLAYDEEFDRPVSFSRTGSDADYAAAKPVYNGAQDFGDAIFPNPDKSLGNVRVVDDRYLRIDVEPNPPGYTDPEGYGRKHIGGLLASARPGGSGFSAQYGYFEARMLVPAAPGTWPSFWMLPSDNLVAPTPVVAEVDAFENYGHEPQSGCQSTHQYKEGDNGGSAQCGQRFPTDRVALSWHTYGVSITPTDITFVIDGRTVAVSPQVQGGGSPMFFLVDLALGGGWPLKLGSVQDRAIAFVDYVRVYV